MKTVTYSVPGIGCGGCVEIIQSELRALDGVQSVKVHVAARQVEVAFDSPASEAKIESLLEELYLPVAG